MKFGHTVEAGDESARRAIRIKLCVLEAVPTLNLAEQRSREQPALPGIDSCVLVAHSVLSLDCDARGICFPAGDRQHRFVRVDA